MKTFVWLPALATAFGLFACAHSPAHSVALEVAEAVALTEMRYSMCAAEPLGDSSLLSHDPMDRCVTSEMPNRCALTSADLARIAELVRNVIGVISETGIRCARSEHRPSVTSAGLVETVLNFSHRNRLTGVDALDTPISEPERMSRAFTVLRSRCEADLVWRVRTHPRAMLSRGEAFLCSAISARWAEHGLESYWPELTNDLTE